jgi:3-deoxy-manno-octulosonate cytidylyltransferase (CMP-KDO synthetase)
MKSIACIIPARFDSTRFPGKPLAQLGNKPMIQHVFERARKVKEFDVVAVATDSEKVADEVVRFGGNVIFTESHHQSGTDRIAEAIETAFIETDYIVNVQGDEPLIEPDQIRELLSLLDGTTEIATLVKRIENKDELFNPNVVKAVIAANKYALYFSRSPIPYVRGVDEADWLSKKQHFKHIGMYAYRRDVLELIAALKPSKLENCESLEQLRWLEAGFSIKTAETSFESMGVDTPEDLEKAKKMLGLS